MLTWQDVCKYPKAKVRYNQSYQVEMGSHREARVRLIENADVVSVDILNEPHYLKVANLNGELATQDIVRVQDCILILKHPFEMTPDELKLIGDDDDVHTILHRAENLNFELQTWDNIINKLYELNIDFHNPSFLKLKKAVHE